MQKLPMRSKKFGVGKEIGGAVYVHKQYIGCLPTNAQLHWQALADQSRYTVVKYSERAGTVSFIETHDFDQAPEPEVGEVLTFNLSGHFSKRKQLSDPYIYHHKWLFVLDDYEGFDVEESKRRSLLWLNLDDIDSRRIGRKSYWIQNVIPKLENKDAGQWLTSREMAKKLRVSDCTLSHLRLAGELEYHKRGTSFLYRLEDSDT